jgi:hypothetical protein
MKPFLYCLLIGIVLAGAIGCSPGSNAYGTNNQRTVPAGTTYGGTMGSLSGSDGLYPTLVQISDLGYEPSPEEQCTPVTNVMIQQTYNECVITYDNCQSSFAALERGFAFDNQGQCGIY